MKKVILVMLLCLGLAGCGTPADLETVSDIYLPVTAVAGTVQVALPDEAAMTVMGQGDGNRMYFCDGYTLSIHILASGDLAGTLQEMTGFHPDRLTVMKTREYGFRCCECVWTSAGEGGDQVGRLMLLDDGNFHYVVSVMAPAEQAGALADTWDKVFASVTLGGTAP